MSYLTEQEYEHIRYSANVLVNTWIDDMVHYRTILRESNTPSSCYLILNIHMEALDLFMNYLYSCDEEILKRFGIHDTSPEKLDKIMNYFTNMISTLRQRIDAGFSVR